MHFSRALVFATAGALVPNAAEAQLLPAPRDCPVPQAPAPTDVNHADGPARQAHFGTIKGLCHAPDGTLFVHDSTYLIRKITPAGQ
jgi:hypothetical protein